MPRMKLSEDKNSKHFKVLCQERKFFRNEIRPEVFAGLSEVNWGKRGKILKILVRLSRPLSVRETSHPSQKIPLNADKGDASDISRKKIQSHAAPLAALHSRG